MSSLSATSTEGNDPTLAADRLGSLIDSITTALHGVVVLVAIILPMCRAQNVDKLNQASSCISSWAGLLWTCSVAEVMAMR